MTYTVHEADALEVLRAMPDNSFHGCLTDPPYGLTTDGGKTGFMGHAWDKGVPPVEVWVEVLRVLKPGAYLLAFGGTRTFHRLTCAIEDAGFEIRDSIAEFFDQDAATQAFLAGLSPAQRKDFDRAFVGSPIGCYLYGAGFPKSHNVSKAIDREVGAVREVVGKSARHVSGKPNQRTRGLAGSSAFAESIGMGSTITAPSTPAARQWSGYGSALKPAFEPVIVARKPLVGTIAQNVQAHGCGALAIDACRVGTDDNLNGGAYSSGGRAQKMSGDPRAGAALGMYEAGRKAPGEYAQPLGRWPANVILSHSPDCVEVGTREVVSRGGNGGVNLGEDRKSYSGGYKVQGEPTGIGETKAGTKYMRSEQVAAYECVDGCPVKALDGQSGNLHSHGGGHAAPIGYGSRSNPLPKGERAHTGPRDSGGASRFFKTFGHAEGERFMYCAKASRKERNEGCDDLPYQWEPGAEPKTNRSGDVRAIAGTTSTSGNTTPNKGNVHPTVKPLALTTYLARLILPPIEGARLLVPFCGSGSEMLGGLRAGWSHVEGIDSWDVALKIARARLAHHEALLAKTEEAEQLSLVGT